MTQKVDFDKLTALGESLGQASSSMSSTLSTMDTDLAFLQAAFTGEAADAYQAAKAAYGMQMLEMTTFLGSIALAAESASRAYQAAEDSITAQL